MICESTLIWIRDTTPPRKQLYTSGFRDARQSCVWILPDACLDHLWVSGIERGMARVMVDCVLYADIFPSRVSQGAVWCQNGLWCKLRIHMYVSASLA